MNLLIPYMEMNENRTRTKRVHNPFLERKQVQSLDNGVPGKTRGGTRPHVSIVRCSTRKLEKYDNLAGSCKALLDCLRYSGLIADDTEEAITCDISQEKVVSRKDHKTKLVIEYED
jgi:hypothetical protein